MSPNMSNHVMTMSDAPHASSHSATINHGADGGMGALVFTSAGVMAGGAMTSRELRDDAALTGEIRDDAAMELQSRCDADKSNVTYSRGKYGE